MALPANWETGQVVGRWIDLHGDPESGNIIFKANVTRLVNDVDDVIIVPADITVALDVNGAIDIDLPATDDTDINPVDFSYTVIEALASGKGKTYSIEIPAGQVTDLSDVVEVEERSGTAYIVGPPSPAPIVHDWNDSVNGAWVPWTARRINPDGVATQSVSVTTPGRGRVTGHATSEGGNYRQVYLRHNTEWTNSRIKSLWWGGNTYGAVARPQAGHCHRGQIVAGVFTGVIVTNNIFQTDPDIINQNLWRSDAGANTLSLGTPGTFKGFGSVLNRSLAIQNVLRFNFNGYINSISVVPSHLYGLAQDDLVNVSSQDSTFNASAEPLTGVNTLQGSVSLAETTTLSAVSLKADTGTVTPPVHKRYWPHWMLSELIGNTLRLKVWRYQDEEPDWGSAAHVQTWDITEPTNITEPIGPGFCGLVAGHLNNSAYLEWGHTEFEEL